MSLVHIEWRLSRGVSCERVRVVEGRHGETRGGSGARELRVRTCACGTLAHSSADLSRQRAALAGARALPHADHARLRELAPRRARRRSQEAAAPRLQRRRPRRRSGAPALAPRDQRLHVPPAEERGYPRCGVSRQSPSTGLSQGTQDGAGLYAAPQG